jgi:uncharacterized protein (TIGR03435 family)
MTRSWLLLLAAGSLAAQDMAHFEVASVKESTTSLPGGGFGRYSGGPGTTQPGQFSVISVSLKNALQDAFNLPDFQYVAPSWMDERIFDIVAKLPPGTTREQFRVMLQNLLIERFRIMVHHEQRPTDVYDLTIAKGGLKIKPSPYGNDVPWVHPVMKRDAENIPMLQEDAGPYSSFGAFPASGGQVGALSTRGSIQDLVTNLSRNLKIPIIDKTGLSGNFVYRLHYRPLDDQADRAAQFGPAPGPFDALENQLGFKLGKRKGSIDVLVIDNAEKVTIEN